MTEDVRRQVEPPLVTYMTADSREARSAAFLRTYAERVRNKTETVWEIPNTRAQTLEDIAALMETLRAEVERLQQETAQIRGAVIDYLLPNNVHEATIEQCVVAIAEARHRYEQRTQERDEWRVLNDEARVLGRENFDRAVKAESEVAQLRGALSALQAEREAPCVRCGTTESADGDWYRICGKCHWETPRETLSPYVAAWTDKEARPQLEAETPQETPQPSKEPET